MGQRSGKFLGVNQSTGGLFRDVMEAVAAEGIDCVLLAGTFEAPEGYEPPFEVIRACRLKKAPAWQRIRTWGTFALQALWQMFRHRDRFALLVTNPPLVPWLGPLARRLFGLRYAVLVYDIYPDLMVRLGMIRGGGWMDRLLNRVGAASYRHADAIITLGERMREVILSQMPEGETVDVTVIPNWGDTDFIRPLPKSENLFAQEHDLADKLVVMYSGAFGATHDIETLIDAAELLQDLEDVRLVLIGGGTREREVRAYAESKALPNVLLLPWQPLENTRFSLTSADAHIISLPSAFEGVMVPSKTYTSLAAGAAILCISGPASETAELVARFDCGVRVDSNDAEALAAAVRRLHADRAGLERMKHNARRAAEEHFSRHICLQQYRKVLLPLVKPEMNR